MIQILLRWDETDQQDKEIIEKLRKGFEKMGSWMVEPPARDSIYKLILTIDKENMEKYKEGQHGKKS